MSSRGLSVDEIDGLWRVAVVKSRQEKKLAYDLIARDVSYFIPYVANRTSSGGKTRLSNKLVFPGYLFFAGDDDTWHQVRETGRACAIIIPPGDAADVLKRELIQLQHAVTHDKVEIDKPMVVGQRIEVMYGPWRGYTGVLDAIKNKVLVEIAITTLGRKVTVEIDPSMIEAAA